MTAGVWIPAPSERRTKSRSSRPRGGDPTETNGRVTRVIPAMAPSAPRIKGFLAQRSAHTPPGKERRHWGRVLHTMAAATQAPEVVSKVRYQTMAIWERVEPNSVMDWLRKTRSARRCQDEGCRFMGRWSGWRGEPYVGQGNQRPSAVLGAQTPAEEAGFCGRCQRHPPPERW